MSDKYYLLSKRCDKLNNRIYELEKKYNTIPPVKQLNKIYYYRKKNFKFGDYMIPKTCSFSEKVIYDTIKYYNEHGDNEEYEVVCMEINDTQLFVI